MSNQYEILIILKLNIQLFQERYERNMIQLIICEFYRFGI